MSLSEVRRNIMDRLDAIAGLAVYERFPDNIEVPCAVVGPSPDTFIDYEIVYKRGTVTYNLRARVYVARADAVEAQAALDAYLAASGSSSVTAALHDTTVAVTNPAAWHDPPSIPRAVGYGEYDVAGIDYLGAEWEIEVMGTA